LREEVDSDRIDREGEIPDGVIEGLKKLGAFGIKIPREYGGLGLSQLSYMKAIELVSSVDGSLTALLSAHQSIGVPQPLKLFGTEAQKKKYFPRLAKGAISAFALTEDSVGSDPAAMETKAILDDDTWILNGEKLWCTNGTHAELLVVMARTPGKEGKPGPITAFIVETAWPGVEVAERLQDVERVSFCVDVGHVGIRQARTSFSREHPGLDLGTLSPQDARLPDLAVDVQRAVRSALPAR